MCIRDSSITRDFDGFRSLHGRLSMQGRRPFPTPARWLLRYCQALSLVTLALTGALFSLHANAYLVEVDAPAPLKKILEQFLDLARYKDRKLSLIHI